MSISNLSEALLKILKEQMPPMLPPEQIGLAPPDTAQGRYLLGLHLFRIAEDTAFRASARIAVDPGVMLMPPLCLELWYMITSYAGLKSETLDDHRILSRVLGIIYDNPELPPYSPLQPESIPKTKIQLISAEADESNKIWQFGGIAQRLSLYYRLAPVPIISGIQTQVSRVAAADFGYEETGRNSG